jgi:hypothetical protein
MKCNFVARRANAWLFCLCTAIFVCSFAHAYATPTVPNVMCNVVSGGFRLSPHHCVNGQPNCAVASITGVAGLPAGNCATLLAAGVALPDCIRAGTTPTINVNLSGVGAKALHSASSYAATGATLRLPYFPYLMPHQTLSYSSKTCRQA